MIHPKSGRTTPPTNSPATVSAFAQAGQALRPDTAIIARTSS